MKRIKRFGVYQTAKVVALIYFLVMAVFMIPFGLISMMFNSDAFPGFPFGGSFFFVLIPFLYGAIIFVMVAIGCVVYNLIAQWTGGIELEFEVVDTGLTTVPPSGPQDAPSSVSTGQPS